ncbi:MAG: alpha/beta hydrolase family protein [Erythrobacter sp.]
MISTWQAPLADGSKAEEMLVAFDKDRAQRLLILPAWFDEANKMRRFTLDVMRSLDERGIDSFLPDLPGCNESLTSLSTQTIAGWRKAAEAAVRLVSATHVLAIRAGALLAPNDLPGWLYAPQTGSKQLRGMIRARTIAAREAGREETSAALGEHGRAEGLTLGGWTLGAEMVRELETASPPQTDALATIAQKDIGGGGLWLRAEPDDDPEQAIGLASIIAGQTA